MKKNSNINKFLFVVLGFVSFIFCTIFIIGITNDINEYKKYQESLKELDYTCANLREDLYEKENIYNQLIIINAKLDLLKDDTNYILNNYEVKSR